MGIPELNREDNPNLIDSTFFHSGTFRNFSDITLRDLFAMVIAHGYTQALVEQDVPMIGFGNHCYHLADELIEARNIGKDSEETEKEDGDENGELVTFREPLPS